MCDYSGRVEVLGQEPSGEHDQDGQRGRVHERKGVPRTDLHVDEENHGRGADPVLESPEQEDTLTQRPLEVDGGFQQTEHEVQGVEERGGRVEDFGQGVRVEL